MTTTAPPSSGGMKANGIVMPTVMGQYNTALSNPNYVDEEINGEGVDGVENENESELNGVNGSNPWTLDDDRTLKELLEEMGNTASWIKIARSMPGNRTMADCRDRWKTLKPESPSLVFVDESISSLADGSAPDSPISPADAKNPDSNPKKEPRKGTWSEEEDLLLLRLMQAMPHRNWGEVAALIHGRSAKQCRERWCYNLDPSIKKDVWTDDEDHVLLDNQRRLGNRWAFIASMLPGRTENAVKTRFKSIMRAKRREWTQEEDDTILKMHRIFGSKWDRIATHLPNRTKNAVRTRYRQLVKEAKAGGGGLGDALDDEEMITAPNTSGKHVPILPKPQTSKLSSKSASSSTMLTHNHEQLGKRAAMLVSNDHEQLEKCNNELQKQLEVEKLLLQLGQHCITDAAAGKGLGQRRASGGLDALTAMMDTTTTSSNSTKETSSSSMSDEDGEPAAGGTYSPTNNNNVSVPTKKAGSSKTKASTIAGKATKTKTKKKGSGKKMTKKGNTEKGKKPNKSVDNKEADARQSAAFRALQQSLASSSASSPPAMRSTLGTTGSIPDAISQMQEIMRGATGGLLPSAQLMPSLQQQQYDAFIMQQQLQQQIQQQLQQQPHMHFPQPQQHPEQQSLSPQAYYERILNQHHQQRFGPPMFPTAAAYGHGAGLPPQHPSLASSLGLNSSMSPAISASSSSATATANKMTTNNKLFSSPMTTTRKTKKTVKQAAANKSKKSKSKKDNKSNNSSNNYAAGSRLSAALSALGDGGGRRAPAKPKQRRGSKRDSGVLEEPVPPTTGSNGVGTGSISSETPSGGIVRIGSCSSSSAPSPTVGSSGLTGGLWAVAAAADSLDKQHTASAQSTSMMALASLAQLHASTPIQQQQQQHSPTDGSTRPLRPLVDSNFSGGEGGGGVSGDGRRVGHTSKKRRPSVQGGDAI